RQISHYQFGMNGLGSERIHHADGPIGISANKRMREIVFFQEFICEDSAIDQIDLSACSLQASAFICEFAGVRKQSGNAVPIETLFAMEKFRPSRDGAIIDYRNGRRAFAAPPLVGFEQHRK